MTTRFEPVFEKPKVGLPSHKGDKKPFVALVETGQPVRHSYFDKVTPRGRWPLSPLGGMQIWWYLSLRKRVLCLGHSESDTVSTFVLRDQQNNMLIWNGEWSVIEMVYHPRGLQEYHVRFRSK
jgi:hypothetical protein